jgi:hypothetical protein
MERHRLVSILTASALTFAAAAAEAPAEARKRLETMNPSFADAWDQASDLYEKADWVGCAQQFQTAAAVAPEDRQASRSFLRAAACAARAGKKETADFAFKLLDKAAARGCRDADRLATDPDLASLRTDPRWPPVVANVEARAAESRQARPVNAELARLYQEDQADRAGDLETSDWRAVERRDAERRKRVLEIAEQGRVKEAADYIHAPWSSSTAPRRTTTTAPIAGRRKPSSSTPTIPALAGSPPPPRTAT